MNDDTEPHWQPTLTGELVHLRPTRPADGSDMFAAASDPQIWAGHPVKDRYTQARFRDYFDGALRSGGALTIVERASGRIIGSSRYHDHDATRGRVEIGYTFLVRACWGRGFNREVKWLMLGHAFRFVETVQFAIASSNLRSRAAIVKIGASLLDEPEMRLTAGELVQYRIYEVHAAWFKARRSETVSDELHRPMER